MLKCPQDYAWEESSPEDDEPMYQINLKYNLYFPELRTDRLFFYLFVNTPALSFYWPIVDRFPAGLVKSLSEITPLKPFLHVLDDYWNQYNLEPSTEEYCKIIEPAVANKYTVGIPSSRDNHNFESMEGSDYDVVLMKSVKAAICLMIEVWFGYVFMPHIGAEKDVNLIHLLTNPIELFAIFYSIDITASLKLLSFTVL